MRWLAPALAGVAICGAFARCHAPRSPRDAATGGIALELFFTGSDDGYLDACGCDDGQTGGLPRRHTLMRYLGLDDGHALLLSTGGLVAGSAPLDVDKFETILQAMQVMGYGGIALTERELALGRAEVVALGRMLGDDCPFLATNLVDTRADADATLPPLPMRRSVVRTLRGEKIAVVASIAESRAPLFTAADAQVRVDPPAPALKAELAAITARDGRPARTVVLAQASAAEAKELARAVPGLDLIVIREIDGDDFPDRDVAHEGTTDIVTTGRKGKAIGRYRFGFGGDMGEFAPEAVTDTLRKSEPIKDLLATYRDLLKESQPIRRYFARAPDRNGATYAGADEATCVQCHAQAWKIWKASRHARAWKTLENQDLPEQPGDKKGHLKNAIWDPECVRCHVTGFGEKTGYRGQDHENAEAPLVNVTCEACHGPSGDHAARAERGDSSYPGGPIARVAGGAAWSLCCRCHDPDNSTAFDLAKYWVGFSHGEQREPVKHGKD